MASGPITSWQIDGRKVEIVTDFIFLGSKITENCDCSHEIKRHLLKKKKKKTLALGRKSYGKPSQHFRKQWHHLANKDLDNQSYGFPVVMYRCETIKEAECQRIHAFELWCEMILLRVSWTARRSNQSIWKEISAEYSFEGLMPKLKLQYFGHLMGRTDSLEYNLMLGKIEGRKKRGPKEWDGWIASPNQWTWVWENSSDSEGQKSLVCCSPWGWKESDTI